jgi:hypothetical protein
MEKTMEDKKKKKNETEAVQAGKGEKLSRREAMRRMAKGIALVGTIGVAGVVTQGQDECSGGYVNLVPPGYYNYSNAGYYDYSNAYYNYNNGYYNYYDKYNDYNNYTDYYNYYDHGGGYSNYHPW